MEENVTIMTVLEELREFRAENNKRWEENDKRWEQNEKRWAENDRRWQANKESLIAIELQTNKNTENITKIEKICQNNSEKIINFEKNRKKDRLELIDVFDRMEQAISKQFADMKNYMDLRFNKIDLALAINDIEHAEFKQLLKAYGIKLKAHDKRLEKLENWKEECDGGQVVGVY